MKYKKLSGACALAAGLLIFFALQRLLVPKYQGQVVEGCFTEEYYRDTVPHQILILGDCEAYENISAIELWEKYGLTSYIRGNANQLPAQSCYLLEEALRQEKPEIVMFSVSALQETGQTNEAYNRMTLDGMRWSDLKVRAILASAMPEEHFIEYIFPILRFHDRWKELEDADIRYYMNVPLTTHNGYYLRADIRPAGEFPTARRLADPMLPAVSMEYLDKIRDLCQKEGVRLVLFKAPSLYPVWHQEWEQQILEYARDNGLLYINCLEHAEDIGINYARDTYDGGMHMNVYGAEKTADYIGSILVSEYGLESRKCDPVISQSYETRTAEYVSEKTKQETDFREYGYIPQYTQP